MSCNVTCHTSGWKGCRLEVKGACIPGHCVVLRTDMPSLQGTPLQELGWLSTTVAPNQCISSTACWATADRLTSSDTKPSCEGGRKGGRMLVSSYSPLTLDSHYFEGLWLHTPFLQPYLVKVQTLSARASKVRTTTVLWARGWCNIKSR